MLRSITIFAATGWILAAIAWLPRAESSAEAGTITVIASTLHSSCDADSDANGTVDVVDLLNVLGAWGECPDGDGDGVRIIDGDCDDADSSVYPGAPEFCDGKDNDCDGQADEDFPVLGSPCVVGLGECQREGVFVCVADGTAVECSVAANPPGVEICGDGLDNDCDGEIDENCIPCAGGDIQIVGALTCSDTEINTVLDADVPSALGSCCSGLCYSCGTPDSLQNQGGAEDIYSFTAQTSGDVGVMIDNLSCDLDLYVLDDLCDVHDGCLAGSTEDGLTDDGLMFPAIAGVTYFIVIESEGQSGLCNYRLRIECGQAE